MNRVCVDDCSRISQVDRFQEERCAFRGTKFRIGRSRKNRTVERDGEHLIGLHAFFLHGARRDHDMIAIADADAPAGPGNPTEVVEGSGEVAD